MATNYQRGRTREYYVMQNLRKKGYHCIRSASSKGYFDVIAIGEKDILLIQVKLSKDGKLKRDENYKLSLTLKVPTNTKKQLWLFAPGSTTPEILELSGISTLPEVLEPQSDRPPDVSSNLKRKEQKDGGNTIQSEQKHGREKTVGGDSKNSGGRKANKN